MVEAGVIVLGVTLLSMLFMTVLTLWYLPKVLYGQAHDHEDDERTDGGQAQV